MNKNVLTVFIVILTPIIILGLLAVAGAERFEEQKQAAEEQHTEGNVTETAAILVPMQDVKVFDLQTNNLLDSIGLRVLA